MDWQAIREIGAIPCLLVLFAYGSWKLVDKFVAIFDGHLKAVLLQNVELIKSHAVERKDFLETLNLLRGGIEKANNYHREEHIKVMSALSSLEKSIAERAGS